jgi:hypothetical protein
MLEYNCLQQTSLVFNTIGTVLMMIVSTRGIDVGGRPSIFFFELTIARLVLGILWAITHLLLSIVVTEKKDELLYANALLDGLHAVVQISQLIWHRYWCVGEAWQRLRRRTALQLLTPWVLFGSFLSNLSGGINAAFLYHYPTERPYYANIAIQSISPAVCIVIIYWSQHLMHRGFVWYVYFLCCAWSLCFFAGSMIAVHYIFEWPISLNEPFGYLGQVLEWVFCTLLCYFFHRDTKPYSGPGCADDTPIAETRPRTDTAATVKALETALETALQTVTPSTPRSSTPTPHASIVSTKDPAGFVGTHVDLSPFSTPIDQPTSVALAMTPTASAHSKSMALQDLDLPEMRDTPLFPSPLAPTTAIVSVASAPESPRVNSLFTVSQPDTPGGITVLPTSKQPNVANEGLMQLHKLLVSFTAWLIFGALLGLCDTLVANIYPDLTRCGQLDPFQNDWASAIRSFFDLFH